MVTRLPPRLPVESMKTYTVASPIETHTREASCEEVGCEAHRQGWLTVADTTAAGQKRARYIRELSGRHFTESTTAGVTEFRFPPGEQCFVPHHVSLEREELYLVRGGDWRGNPTGERLVHSGPDAWLNDCGEHLDTLKRAIEGNQ